MIDLLCKLAKEDKVVLGPHLTGWNTLHPFILSLDVNEEGLTILRKLLTLEIKGECRFQIVSRLVGRIRNVRKPLEEQLLFQQMNGKWKPSKPKKRRPKKPKKQVVIPNVQNILPL